MKHIKLERIGTDDDRPVVDYASLLREVIRRPLNPQGGADVGEMRQSIRVLDALDAANGVLELEDADYEHLTQKLTAMPWNLIDKRVLQFIDDIYGAQ